MVATKQARNKQGSQQNGRENNFYRAQKNGWANTCVQRLSESRILRRQSSPKGTFNFKSNTAESASDLQSSFSFSSRYSWKACPTFTRVWPLCRSVSLFSSSVPPTLGFSVSRLIYDEYNNPLVTCVYIEPVPCLGVCAAKQFVTSRDPRLPREWAAGRRQKHIHFLRQDAQGGVETTNNRTKMYNRTIAMTLSLLY